MSPSVRSTPAASESGNESIDDLSDSSMSEEVLIGICVCGAVGRAHKRSCPLSLRNRKPGRTLFPASDSGAPAAPSVQSSPERHTPAPSEDMKPNIEFAEYMKPKVEDVKPETEGGRPTVEVEDYVKPEIQMGVYVCIHSGNVGDFHVPCRIVGEMAGRYQLYCSKGVLNTSFSSTELTPLTSFSPIPLDEWRWAPKVSPRSVINEPALRESCTCHVTESLERITVSSASEGENKAPTSKTLSKETVRLIASMVHVPSSELKIVMMDVKKQSNGSDCGVLAIAYAFDICSGMNPCSVRFDHSKIRPHLITCLENCQVSRFPVLGDRERVSRESQRQWSSTAHVACQKKRMISLHSVIPATSGITATAWTFPVRCLGTLRSTGSARGV